jgi:uncharacterized protein
MLMNVAMLTFMLVATALPEIVAAPDGMMDSPQPTAPIANWTDAAGRARVTLAVPGATLRGYVYDGAVPSGPTLIVFGGSGNLIQVHDAASRGFAQHAARVVWYDYRGYGYSSGVAHFADLRADALRIFDATQGTYPHAPIVVLGYSMGTAIADFVATKRPISGLILVAPWNDEVGVLENLDPKHSYRLTPEAMQDFDETGMLAGVTTPLLVIQGTQDDVIPPSQGPALERGAASPDKRFVPVQGAKHNGMLENPVTQAAVAEFLTKTAE